MPKFVPWNSQPLDAWAERYAAGAFIDLAGRSTHYIEKGEGPPLILLHGFFYDSYLWAQNVDTLAREFKVYVPDLWGFGYSTREPMDYGYALYAEQVRLFMDGLGIERAVLAGQSMGGGTAVKFCVAHRARVEKLLLVAPAGMPNPMPWVGKFFALPGVGEYFLSRSTDAVRKSNLKRVFLHRRETLTPAYFENVTRHHKIKGTTESSLAVLRNDFFDKLGEEIDMLGTMDVPSLIVWGREDKAIPVDRGKRMQRVLTGSRLEIVDGAGHALNSECPGQFNRLALGFLGADRCLAGPGRGL